VSTRGSVIAGAVASALWLALGGLYAALVWFAVVPVDALRLVIPEVVPARAWYRDAPWMVVLPLLAALLFGALVVLAAQVVSRLSAGSSRALVFAAVWLGAIVAALLVGGASALAGTIESWPPPRASFVVRGWFETIAPALYGGALWGWVPALVATRMRPETAPRDARLPAAVVAAVLLVATVAGGALARASDGILPPDLTQPVPEAVPLVTPPASSIEAPVPPGADWCTAEELGVRVAGGDAATGHRVAVIAVTPLFDEPCVLPGYPDVAFADAAGSDLNTPVSPGGGFMSEDPGPANLLLTPGEEAATWITWDAVAAGPGEIGTIWIAPWPGATRAILAFDHGTDIANGAAVAVTAWQPYPTDAFAP
jgi:hypothetical protein